jgi:hypothetical protein
MLIRQDNTDDEEAEVLVRHCDNDMILALMMIIINDHITTAQAAPCTSLVLLLTVNHVEVIEFRQRKRNLDRLHPDDLRHEQ